MSQSYPLRGEIYWANLEPVKGSEQGGSRPVLVVSNNIMNMYAKIILVVPMTRNEEKVKSGPFNISFEIASVKMDVMNIEKLNKKGYKFAPQNGVILCNQARAISKNRLIGSIGKFDDISIIKKVETALVDAFALLSCEVCGIPLGPKGLSCKQCGRVYRKLCIGCSSIIDINFNYCPHCGKGVNK